ncbi:MAG: leucine--tRNA ligase [FCB group bacterium]|nr:leucine--tRNA ligase [FCB group bacterium]
MNDYSFREIENKWQKIWSERGDHKVDMESTENKFYCLNMFGYPSGDRFHVGHWYQYGPADSYARYMKMRGYNVLQPQGFDAFGLPAENYAIKHGVHPAVSTVTNVNNMREQLKRMGGMYDWSNEINTSEPEYYKWTQWLFLQLLKMGLAYQKEAPVNWCPSCVTVLANEQVKEGKCERCDSSVTKRSLKQWFFRITSYTEELLSKLDDIDWPEKTKHMQRNWIGKSVGASVKFKLKDFEEFIEVFTTRSDTLYGATYFVLAPEHPLIDKIVSAEHKSDVIKYIEDTKKKTEIERTSLDRDKTGVFTGAYVINPVNNAEIPVWIADYVVASYGTGAIMAVPSGDERDFEFAQKFDIPIIEVVSPDGNIHGADQCYSEYGIAVNSGPYDGMETEDVQEAMNQKLSQMKIGGRKIQYKLHDWLISRQRYWGAPIPVVHCEECGAVPVPEQDLPVLLPKDIVLQETYGADVSPLAVNEKFMQVKCPKCGEDARRDPDTMDTFVCSSWYYLRYPNARYKDHAFDQKRMDWMPVDQYIGGVEHATMHLLYARFITKALRDAGYLHFDEPFTKLFHQGTITKDGAKMSKSRGNTVSPDDFIEKYGSDTFRAYLMFMGPYDEGGDWNDKGITGIFRWLKKIWRLCHMPLLEKLDAVDLNVLHSTIKSVSSDLSQMKFNTSISRLMEFVNHFSAKGGVTADARDQLIRLLAPIAPHISEELWEHAGHSESVFNENWPEHIEKLTRQDTITIAIQVNGKLRGSIDVDKSVGKDELLNLAKVESNIEAHLTGKRIVKEIFVPGRLVNFVVK